MKFYRLLVTIPGLLYDGAIFTEIGLKKIQNMGYKPVVEECKKEDNAGYYFISSDQIGEESNSGERNVFYDASGNEYHN